MKRRNLNPEGWRYRAVVLTERSKRILGYAPSFGEAANLANARSADFAHVEKNEGGNGWVVIED